VVTKVIRWRIFMQSFNFSVRHINCYPYQVTYTKVKTLMYVTYLVRITRHVTYTKIERLHERTI
jgi:hypothetical protein